MTGLIASVELGGTKTIVAVAEEPARPLAIERFATTDPERTIAGIIAVLTSMTATHGTIEALGVAGFGPLDLGRGRLLGTPKPGWRGVELGLALRQALDCPVSFETDVNAAALAEAAFGAGRDFADLAYVTVGTGIGGGLMLDRLLRHGHLHPEMGHLPIRRHREDPFEGICPFHGDCLEGLASGPAIIARLGRPLDQFGPDHPFRAILSFYLAQLCANLILITSVPRIVLGGGVLTHLNLLGAIENATREQLGGYVARLASPFLIAPMLMDAGLVGGLLLARSSLRSKHKPAL